jgi:hypothetical protein
MAIRGNSVMAIVLKLLPCLLVGTLLGCIACRHLEPSTALHRHVQLLTSWIMTSGILPASRPKPKGPQFRPPPALGHVWSDLEEKFQETEPFHIGHFAQHNQRVSYQAEAADEWLLSTAGAIDFEGIEPETRLTDASHPLRSCRLAAELRAMEGPERKRRRHGTYIRHNVLLQQRYRNAGHAHDEPPLSMLHNALPVGTPLLRVALFRGAEKVRELEVHAEQTLEELASRLQCSTSVDLAYQYGELETHGSASQFPPPSDAEAFCIEGAWYIRGEEDLSSEVRPWLAAITHPEGCTSASEPPRLMAGVRFSDLTIRLGRQYLFVHHGNCEHALVFTQCWLACATDVQIDGGRDAYPRVVFLRRKPTLVCSVCSKMRAVWECLTDRLADVSPCYLCQVCHFHFHYTADGLAKRTDYRIFPLIEDTDALDLPRRVDSSEPAASLALLGYQEEEAAVRGESSRSASHAEGAPAPAGLPEHQYNLGSLYSDDSSEAE